MGKTKDEARIDTSSFQTENEILILNTLKQIQEKGNLNHFYEIIDLIKKTQSNTVKKQALKLIKEIKSTKTKDVLVELTKQFPPESVSKEIVSLCWEIKVDLSDQLMYFIKILLTADLETAIEAYSVITENAEFVPEEKAIEYKKELFDGLSATNSDKKALVVDCIKLFSIDQ